MFSIPADGETLDAFKGIWPVTDKTMIKSLNGEWSVKVIPGITNDKNVPPADDTWRSIPVPSCWEEFGFCKPTYSFPDSLTGYYRTPFVVPKEWKGQRVVIRFDGVLRGYDLWLNGHLVGSWEQAYNTCLFDLTPYLTKKAFRGEPQQLAMRVYSRFKGFEFDCFDDWSPMGIFRDVTLFTVPNTHLSDLIVITKPNGEFSVKTQLANATKHTRTECKIIDAQGRVVSKGEPLENPLLWTAETPYLYTLRVYVKEKEKTLQTFEQKIGFREVSIDGNVLKVNGKPVKLRGVTCHATDPQHVKVINEALTKKDMHLMKDASINYIRTSHYPREPRFYELADSLGFYLVNEVPMGSRGEKNLSKIDYQDLMRSRVAATLQRDKNHASVIVWSIGNENPLPPSCQALGEYAKTFDNTRPICYPQKGSYFRSVDFEKFPVVADIYAPHYPTTKQLRNYYTQTDRPLIFTEYCHTLGISFEDHDRQWDIIERTPGIVGGSVWEWVDQGMPFVRPGEGDKWRTDGSECDQRVFTSLDGGFEMKGNFGTDGLLYADRTPLPNYYELQHNYARAFVDSLHIEKSSAISEGCRSAGVLARRIVRFSLHNRYDFLNLIDNVTFHWMLTNNRDTVMRGAFSPDCPPRTTVPYALSLPRQNGLSLLQFDIQDGQGHSFLHQSFVLNKPEKIRGDNCESKKQESNVNLLCKYVQDANTKVNSVSGQSFLNWPNAKCLVRAGRKATMAERITIKDNRLGRYLLKSKDSLFYGKTLSEDSVCIKADVQVEKQTLGAASSDGGLNIFFALTPKRLSNNSEASDVFLPELGLAFLLDAKIDRVQWIGQGPFPSYPGRHQANRYGFWNKHMDDLYFEGNHGGVDAALFTDADGNGLLVVGDSLDLNFEQTDRGIVLTVNAAVSGQGPKFTKTAFGVWANNAGTVSKSFTLYGVEANRLPAAFEGLFSQPSQVSQPFHPFLTQYDTYLLRFNDIIQ